MTQEEKAKRYDEAIERAKEKYAMFEGMKQGDVLEDVFPELKESEDERMAKHIIDIVKCKGYDAAKDENFYAAEIAWLEKQGEKGTNGNEREIPNSAWSEEDENIRQWIVSDIDKLLALRKKSSIIADKEINWLKSLKDRYTWKPSDEQIQQLGWVAGQNKDNMIGKELMSLYQDLKKLREE